MDTRTELGGGDCRRFSSIAARMPSRDMLVPGQKLLWAATFLYVQGKAARFVTMDYPACLFMTLAIYACCLARVTGPKWKQAMEIQSKTCGIKKDGNLLVPVCYPIPHSSQENPRKHHKKASNPISVGCNPRYRICSRKTTHQLSATSTQSS